MKPNPIEQFIANFTQGNETIIDRFLNGYCYYFALMLKERFGGKIFYQVIEGHFYLCIDNVYYDVRGAHSSKEVDWQRMVGWDSFKQYDSLQYERIVQGCILKTT
jgi:hypothetical protein